MVLSKIAALLITLAGVSYLGWKKPAWLVYLLPVAVALEISVLWYPGSGSSGAELGSISLARIVTLALILAGFGRVVLDRSAREKLFLILRQPVSLALLIYIALGFSSVLYSVGRGKTVVETVRLVMLFSLFLAIGLLARPEQSKRIFFILHGVGVGLVPIGYLEVVTAKFLWFQAYYNGFYSRVNTTFVDPNVYARFLVMAIIANLVLQLLADRRWKRLAYITCLLVLLVGLAMALSRAGMLTLAVVLAAMLVLLPSRVTLIPVGLCGLFSAGVLFYYPGMVHRFVQTVQGIAATDPERLYLTKAALDMFKTHPLLGVGLGANQEYFLTNYLSLRTVPGGSTLSQTTVLRIASELGTLGLLALGWVVVCVLRLFLSLRTHSFEIRVLSSGFFLWLLAIFFSSQFAGRLFEDPMLWLSLGMLILLDLGGRRFPQSSG